jgi:protein subunit release factor B
MINLRVQAGDGGADASDFARTLAKMIEKSTGQTAVVDGSEYHFTRL